MLETESRNGASTGVPATGANAISMSRPSVRYFTIGLDVR